MFIFILYSSNIPNERKQQQNLFLRFYLVLFSTSRLKFILKTYVMFIIFLTACVVDK